MFIAGMRRLIGLEAAMDMKTPDLSGSVAGTRTSGKLEHLAEVLGCSTDLFFETTSGPSTSQTAQLLQMWLAIQSSNDRQAVFACVREILQTQSKDFKRG